MTTPPHDGPFVLVLNPGSGHVDADATRAAIAAVFEPAGRAFEIVPIDDPTRIAQIAQRAVERAREIGGVVVALGGDGTLNAVAQAVLGSGLAFGVVPQGTFNYFGRTHGIPQEREAALRALLRAKPRAVQVGRVNERLFLVNASLGLYPKLLQDREAWKQQYGRSRFVALIAGLATLARERRQLTLRIDEGNETRVLRTPTLFVGNNALQLDQVGVAEADAVARNRGRLAAILVKPVSSLRMLWLAMRGALGRLGETDQVTTFEFRRIVVDPVGKRRITVATDGEITRMRTPLTFEVAPEPLMLMLPLAEDRVEVA
jgi:diacylglycerol kinase family enzyme